MSQRPSPTLGVLEWFPIGDYDLVERTLNDMNRLGVGHLRTGVSWADCYTERGVEWVDWLLPRLAKEVEVLPCFTYTPPSIAVAPRPSAPPRKPRDYADWLDQMIARHGRHFEWVELWNEPNNLSEWDWTLDPEWRIFCEMVGAAAYWAQRKEKKVVLGGMSPVDPNWIRLMGQRGVLEYVDVVGIHGFPGAWTAHWEGWASELAKAESALAESGSRAKVWITETGCSTWNHEAWGQAGSLLRALDVDVERVYWYGIHDLSPEKAAIDGFHVDERDYHFGLKTNNGKPKTLFRLWEAKGLEEVRWIETLPTPHVEGTEPITVITGGCGFIGTNVADRELTAGRRVRLFDNLIRPGVEHNLRWLNETHGDQVEVVVGDVRDLHTLRNALANAERVFHFAAQVAVTTSTDDPVDDFSVNAVGTLNLLEELRRFPSPPSLLFTSTNKVYGDLSDVSLKKIGNRYEPRDLETRQRGVDETRSLEFHSPYGCSKGAADQYVLDYARTFGIPATVFRMSCIYGPHQFGNEDQGWVAHFLIKALGGNPITLFGDGKQVRDVLFVDDLVEAMQLAMANVEKTAGMAFNIGGGPSNTTSLLELVSMIGRLTGMSIPIEFGDWRTGDQRYYVSDTQRFANLTGWTPRVCVEEGISRLAHWLVTHSPTLSSSNRLSALWERNDRGFSLR